MKYGVGDKLVSVRTGTQQVEIIDINETEYRIKSIKHRVEEITRKLTKLDKALK